MAGRYVLTDFVNDKPAWVYGTNALWHTGSGWMFGLKSNIVSNQGLLFLNENTNCPQVGNSWYVSIPGTGWTPVASSEVSIECNQYAGKKGLQKLTQGYWTSRLLQII